MPSDFGGARPQPTKPKRKVKVRARTIPQQRTGPVPDPRPQPTPKPKPKPTGVFAKPGLGSSTHPLRKDRDKATRKVKATIRRLPKAQRPVERAKLRASNRSNTLDARAKQALYLAEHVYDGDDKTPELPRRGDLIRAVERGFAKDYEVMSDGNVKRKVRRAVLPDTSVVVPTRKMSTDQLIQAQGVAKAEAPVYAAAGKALNETMRTSRAVAGAATRVARGEGLKGAAKGAKEGLIDNKEYSFGKLLKEQGAPDWLAGTVGFGLDVATDPATYVTFGAGSVARKSAVQSAKRAHSKAIAKGLSNEQAERMGKAAYRQSLKNAKGKGDAKGLTVKVAGKEVPGVRKATGKTVGRAGQKVAGKASSTRPGAGVRNVVADVNPRVRPADVSRETVDAAAAASRTARGRLSKGMTETQNRAVALRKKIGEDNYQKVIDAIEAGKIGRLPDELREAAVFFRSQMRYANRMRRQAGIKGGERRNYVPHALADPLEHGKGIHSAGVGRRQVRPGSSKQRKEQRTLAELRAAEPGKYSEDLPLLYANRMEEGFRSVTQAKLNRALADLGRTVTPRRLADGTQHLKLKDGEAVYHVKGSDIRQLDPKDIGRLEDGKLVGGGGRYVVASEALVENALAAYRQAPAAAKGIGRAWDKTQGAWKFAVTQPNPGFHVRNLIGDSHNAYLAEGAGRLARNVQHSRRTLRRVNKTENAQRTLGATPKHSRRSVTLRQVDATKDGLKIQGKFMSYDQLAREAQEAGAIRSGFVAREIPELVAGKGSTRKVKTKRATRHVGRALQNREDLIRLATYIAGRKRGLSPEEATTRAMKYHFDYANLTQFERNVARRLMPFYTWSARNIPLQARSLVAKPGKFANYEKLRQEAALVAGLPDDWQDSLDEWEQRGLPIPYRIAGVPGSVAFGTPIADLNILPDSLKPGEALDEFTQKFIELWSPLIKSPIELFMNYSFFFRDQIERDTGPLVAAPAWVGTLPGWAKDALGVKKGLDRRTGDQVWKWRGKAAYLRGLLLPGPANTLNNLMSGTDRRGRGTGEKAVGALGLRAVPMDPVQNQINRLYDRLDEINAETATLRQTLHNGKEISADNPTPEYTRLLEEARMVEREIYGLSKGRGDREPYGQAPPKGRSSGGGGFSEGFGSGFGGGFGGGF